MIKKTLYSSVTTRGFFGTCSWFPLTRRLLQDSVRTHAASRSREFVGGKCF